MNENETVHERVWRYAQMDRQELFEELHLSPKGYNEQQVADSKERYGNNRGLAHGQRSLPRRLFIAFFNPFTVILSLLLIVSFLTDVLLASNFTRNLSTVLIILSMLLISCLIRFLQELRAKHVADHLSALLHTDICVRRNNAWKTIDPADLVIGDTVRLQAGDRVPADLRLIRAKDLFVSQSTISGESAVLEKDAVPLPTIRPKSYKDYHNTVFMGSIVIGGSAEGIVAAMGKDSVYGGVFGIDNNQKNQFAKGANAISWVLIRFIAILVPLVFIAGGITKGNWLSAFLFALSVAVGLIPEMLPMVITACLVKGSAAMGQKQTVVKNINAMQGFGSMDVLCVDKTGTLTGDAIVLEYYMDILGNESTQVLDYAYLNSLYHTGIANHLDQALINCRQTPQQQAHFDALAAACKKLDELPFDHERKLASVLVEDDKGPLLLVKGSVAAVCRRCRFIEHKGNRTPMDASDTTSIHAIVDEMSEDGMKVLAVAYRRVNCRQLHPDEERELTLLGYLAFFDAPKQSASAAIRKLQEQHVAVKILTGDQRDVTLSVCRRLRLDTEETISGAALAALSSDEQAICIEKTTVFCELTPKQKAHIVQTLQQHRHTVGFLGDGMNDLPAIITADVGISVDNATDALRESADVILMKKDLNVLEEGILEGRNAFFNMMKYIRITASSNFGNILSIVAASVFLPFFPMTAVQLLLLNLLYDTICLILPWDRADREDTAYPLEWSGATLGRFMRIFGPISSLFDLVTYLFLFFFLCPAVCGGSFASLSDPAAKAQFIAVFQTGWFLESMWTQVLILHLLRTKQIPLLQSRPSAAMMIVTMLGVLLFTALTISPFGQWIQLTALPPQYFLFLFLIVLSYLSLMMLVKRWYIRKYHKLI